MYLIELGWMYLGVTRYAEPEFVSTSSLLVTSQRPEKRQGRQTEDQACLKKIYSAKVQR